MTSLNAANDPHTEHDTEDDGDSKCNSPMGVVQYPNWLKKVCEIRMIARSEGEAILYCEL